MISIRIKKKNRDCKCTQNRAAQAAPQRCP